MNIFLMQQEMLFSCYLQNMIFESTPKIPFAPKAQSQSFRTKSHQNELFANLCFVGNCCFLAFQSGLIFTLLKGETLFRNLR